MAIKMAMELKMVINKGLQWITKSGYEKGNYCEKKVNTIT